MINHNVVWELTGIPRLYESRCSNNAMEGLASYLFEVEHRQYCRIASLYNFLPFLEG